MRKASVLLSLILLFASALAVAQYCPVEKIPTNIDLYVDRSNTTGVIDATATLTGTDLAGKASAPLALKPVYFQECAIGNVTPTTCPPMSHVCSVQIVNGPGGPEVAPGKDAWNCSTGCCMLLTQRITNAEGRAEALFPDMENVTIVAVYLGGDAYLPSNSTANYLYPPVLGALSITACWPLFFFLGLLMLAMSAMGQSPLGAFDFSSTRIPKAKGVGVAPMVFAPGAAVAKAIAGTKAAKREGEAKKAGDAAVKAENAKRTTPMTKGEEKALRQSVRKSLEKKWREQDAVTAKEGPKGFWANLFNVAVVVTTAKWANVERKSKAMEKLAAMKENGEISWDTENMKWKAKDESKQSEVDALRRQAENELGHSGFLKAVAKIVGKAMIVPVVAEGRLIDAGLHAITGGHAGKKWGEKGEKAHTVSLVKMAGFGKGLAKGAKEVAKDAVLEEEVETGGRQLRPRGWVKPFIAVGKGAAIAADVTKHTVNIVRGKEKFDSEDSREWDGSIPIRSPFTGKKLNLKDLNIGNVIHIRFGNRDMIERELQKDKKSYERMRLFNIANADGMGLTLPEVQREIERRRTDMEEFGKMGLVKKEKDGRFTLTKTGESVLKGKNEGLSNEQAEGFKKTYGGSGERNARERGVSYNDLVGISALPGQKTSVDDNMDRSGNRGGYGVFVGDMFVPQRATITADETGRLQLEEPEPFRDPLGAMAILTALDVGSALIDSRYVMKFQQEKIMPEISGRKRVGSAETTPVTYDGRRYEREKEMEAERTQEDVLAVGILSKDIREWSENPEEVRKIIAYAVEHPDSGVLDAIHDTLKQDSKQKGSEGDVLPRYHETGILLNREQHEALERELSAQGKKEGGFDKKTFVDNMSPVIGEDAANAMVETVERGGEGNALGRMRTLSAELREEREVYESLAPFNHEWVGREIDRVSEDIRQTDSRLRELAETGAADDMMERLEGENRRVFGEQKPDEKQEMMPRSEFDYQTERKEEFQHKLKYLNEKRNELDQLQRMYEGTETEMKTLSGNRAGQEEESANSGAMTAAREIERRAAEEDRRRASDPYSNASINNIMDNVAQNQLEEAMARRRAAMQTGKYADLYQ